MYIGVNSEIYARYPLPLRAKKIREHGFNAIDFGGFVHTETPFFAQEEAAFHKELALIREAYEKEGITLFQTHGPWRHPAKDFTPEDRAERLAAMKKSVRGTATLGAKFCVIHSIMPFGTNTEENPEEFFRLNREHFLALCEEGEKFGVTVCLENMPFTRLPFAHIRDITAFVRSLGSEHFRVCLDTGHTVFFDNADPKGPAEGIRLAGELLATLHVHDNDGKSDQHNVPGSGILDWSAFSAALRESGYDGSLSLELHTPQGDDAAFDAECRRAAEVAHAIAEGRI